MGSASLPYVPRAVAGVDYGYLEYLLRQLLGSVVQSTRLLGQTSSGELVPVLVDDVGRVQATLYGKDYGTGEVKPVAVDGSARVRSVVENFPSDYPDSGTHSRLDRIAGYLYDSAESKTVTDIVREIRDKPEWGYLTNIDIDLSTLRDAIVGADSRTLTDIYDQLASRLPRVLYDSAGNELSGYIKNLDVALSTRASESTLSTVADRLYNSAEGKSITDIVTEIRDNTDTVNSRLADIQNKLAQPTMLKSTKVTKDNSSGTTDLVEALFSTSTPSRSAILYRDPNDTGTIYVGDSSTQEFPFEPGDRIVTRVSDLANIYVRVPAGTVANIYVLWEV